MEESKEVEITEAGKIESEIIEAEKKETENNDVDGIEEKLNIEWDDDNPLTDEILLECLKDLKLTLSGGSYAFTTLDCKVKKSNNYQRRKK